MVKIVFQRSNNKGVITRFFAFYHGLLKIRPDMSHKRPENKRPMGKRVCYDPIDDFG